MQQPWYLSADDKLENWCFLKITLLAFITW